LTNTVLQDAVHIMP